MIQVPEKSQLITNKSHNNPKQENKSNVFILSKNGSLNED